MGYSRACACVCARLHARTCAHRSNKLASLAADAASKLHVLWHDGDTLRVDRAQVGILEEGDEVRLRCLLQREDGVRLEADVLRGKSMRYLPNQALEG